MEGWLLVVVMTMVKKDVPVSVIVPSTVTTVIMVMIMMLLSTDCRRKTCLRDKCSDGQA